MIHTIISYVMFLLLAFCSLATPGYASEFQSQPKLKKVILLIGDGMGLAQIQAGMIAKGEPLNIERFPVTGLAKTTSSDNLITDSAAAGTAMACGVKTYNGAIGVDAKGRPCRTILELSEKAGLSTGLVATSVITHATPASFIAHVENRYQYEDIALGFMDTDFELIIGGGKKHFANRRDKRDLIAEFQKSGYYLADSLAALPGEAPGKLVGLFNSGDMPTMLEGRGDVLPRSTHYAIDLLNNNEEGFFLMVEGSQIDWGGHDTEIEYVVTEMIDFDEAIGEALDFAEQDKHTLVIVTADHETGGLSIKGPDFMVDAADYEFSTSSHTAVMVPVFAYGPGAQNFSGIYENTEIFFKLKALMGL